jgi:hypothetical protein
MSEFRLRLTDAAASRHSHTFFRRTHPKLMSQQHRKYVKRARRNRYLRRKADAARASKSSKK